MERLKMKTLITKLLLPVLNWLDDSYQTVKEQEQLRYMEMLEEDTKILTEELNLMEQEIGKLTAKLEGSEERVLQLQGELPEEFPLPKELQPISEARLKVLVKKFTEDYEILDGKYETCSIKELKKFLRYNKVSTRKWLQEDWDCDDFARQLWADSKKWVHRLPIGLCTITLKSYRHAINIFIDDKQDIWFIEPQNDKCYKGYFPGLVKVDRVNI